MALTVILTFLTNLVFILGNTEVGLEPEFRPDNSTHFDVYASALSKAHYNPWSCNYRTEPGYRCLSCVKALHCYPGNFALLVQCAGLFPFCRQGYCSRYKADACIEEPVSHAGYTPVIKPLSLKENKTTILPTENIVTDGVLHDEISESDQVMDETATSPISTELNDSNKVIDVEIMSNSPSESSLPGHSME